MNPGRGRFTKCAAENIKRLQAIAQHPATRHLAMSGVDIRVVADLGRNTAESCANDRRQLAMLLRIVVDYNTIQEAADALEVSRQRVSYLLNHLPTGVTLLVESAEEQMNR